MFLVIGFFACRIPSVQKNEAKLIEYPVPFYLQNESLKSQFFNGIETPKFIYLRDFKGPWLLYDKRIKSNKNYNLIGLDEYVFIQSDLDDQLKNLLKVKNDNSKVLNLKMNPWRN